jgi:NAD-dependent deacetylase
MAPMDADLRRLADWFSASSRVVALTGAGMSAESGIPTFRGGDSSLWQQFDPEQLASMAGWRRDAPLMWGWYVWRMAQVRHAEPNAGHVALARLQHLRPLTVVTQNVDDLHERAGSDDVLHLHGSLFACRCTACGLRADVDIPADAATAPRASREPERCRHCAATIRPGVVWFGEALPEAVWHASVQAIRGSDLLLVIGTSGLVQPAASLAGLARQHGARVVEVNPQASAISHAADLVLRHPAASTLALLHEELARRS